MRVSVTFSRCFALGLHSRIVNVSGYALQRALQAGGSEPRPALDQTSEQGSVP